MALLAPLAPAVAAVALLAYHVEGQEGLKPSSSDGGNSIAIRPRPIPEFTVSIDTDQEVYYVGEAVEIDFRASEDCRVYIFNTDSDGVTRQIFPNYYDQDNLVRGGRHYTIPTGRYRLVTTGPAGSESLRILAYRRPWRALESWNEFPSGGTDPFPRRSLIPDEMRKRVESEAKAAPREYPNTSGERGGLSIVPIPRDRFYYDYAEKSVQFRVRSYRESHDWPEPLPAGR
jgi:hypothetical protein